MATTIKALRKLGLQVNGEEPTSNNVGNIINEIANEYTGGGTGGMENPMTSMGDIIYGGPDGDPTALAKGTQGQVLTATATGVAWQTPSASGAGLYKHSIPFQFVDGETSIPCYLEFVNTRSTAYPNDTFANFETFANNFSGILYQAFNKYVRMPGAGYEGADVIIGIFSGDCAGQGVGNFKFSLLINNNAYISPISSIEDLIAPIESASAQYITYTDTVTAL